MSIQVDSLMRILAEWSNLFVAHYCFKDIRCVCDCSSGDYLMGFEASLIPDAKPKKWHLT